jgi:hypothetical protein
VHVPQRAAVVVPEVMAGNLRAHRELQQQRVQQVHGERLVAAVRRLEDRAQPRPHRTEPGDVGVRRPPGRRLVASEEVADGLHRGERVLAPERFLAVHEAHGVIRVIGQFHL